MVHKMVGMDGWIVVAIFNGNYPKTEKNKNNNKIIMCQVFCLTSSLVGCCFSELFAFSFRCACIFVITFKLADNSYFKWQFRYVFTNCLAFELLILVSGCGVYVCIMWIQ